MARPLGSAAVCDGWRTLCAYADVLATSRATASTWHEHRELRLQRLLDGAARASRVYAQRLAEAGAQRGSAMQHLQRLRPVAKRELMRRFDDWVTDPALELSALRAFVADRSTCGRAFLDRFVVWESSGSSGEPGLFVQDERALAVADALEAARGPATLDGGVVWSAPAAAFERIALVAATTGHFAAVVAFERARQLNPWLAVRSHAFSFMQPLPQLLEQLDAFAPRVLATYPGMAWVLAQAQLEGRLHIAPRALWTGGETLTPALRRRVGEAFGANVRDSYGASECFLIASECRCGHLHLHADWVILEPVDAQGRPVPEGEFGHTTLLTSLSNEVQPVIRYALGDRVRFVGGACDCGSSLPVIEVQGRADDVLTLRDPRGHAARLPPLALTAALEDGAGVFDFQLRQRGARVLELALYGVPAAASRGAPPRNPARRAADALHDYLRSQGLGGTRVLTHCEAAPAQRGRSGKQQRVIATSPA